VWFAPKTKVTPVLLKVHAAQAEPLAVVTVPDPEPESKNTASTDVGADAPLAPLDVADQFAVDEASHVPVPPTQYLFAIVCPFGFCERYHRVTQTLFHAIWRLPI
jgi:hypothetical protein